MKRFLFMTILACCACGNPVPGEESARGQAGPGAQVAPQGTEAVAVAADPVKLPFPVAGDCEGLMLSWFDGEGVHAAQSRAEIPEEHREHVRIASLAPDPSHRAPQDMVFVADLRMDSSERYPVVQMARSGFDALVDAAGEAAAPDGEVVVYSASWCGACKATREYLDKRHVPFVVKDVEKDPGANAEMQRKARAAGKTPRGVPVIDFDGEILLGFDQAGLERLIARRGA